jgi:hypothetical protein
MVGATAAFTPLCAQFKAFYVEAVEELLAEEAADAEDAHVVVANDEALPVAQPVP